MTVVFYISGHGFGHASRDIELINALLDVRPDLPILVRTPAARWLFDLTLRHSVPFEAVATDTGIAQIDSLHLDVAETVGRAQSFYADFDARVAAEAARLRDAGARLVVADIPPVAFAAAHEAGIPAIAFGNFTWDWIYGGYPEFAREAPGVLSTLREAYRLAARAIRLPMHGGFETIKDIQDVPFVARHSRRDPADVRRQLGLDAQRQMALLSFGGHGLEGLELDRIDAARQWTIVTTGQVGGRESAGHVVDINEHALYDQGLRYEDLVAAADVVATKPGYGIIAECLANHTALLYTSRGHFVEYDVLVGAIPHFLRCRFIDQDNLYAGRWLAHLDALITQPPPPTSPPTNGAQVAAALVLEAYDAHERA